MRRHFVPPLEPTVSPASRLKITCLNGAPTADRWFLTTTTSLPTCLYRLLPARRDRQRIIDLIAPAQRHSHFGSMQSSQALAQSVFGTITILNRLPLMSAIVAEDGRA